MPAPPSERAAEKGDVAERVGRGEFSERVEEEDVCRAVARGSFHRSLAPYVMPVSGMHQKTGRVKQATVSWLRPSRAFGRRSASTVNSRTSASGS